jgi:hypothetical protein
MSQVFENFYINAENIEDVAVKIQVNQGGFHDYR